MILLSNLRKFIYPVKIVIDNIPENSNILDIGCGDGHLLKEIPNDYVN